MSIGSGNVIPEPEVDLVSPLMVTYHVFPRNPDPSNDLETGEKDMLSLTPEPLTVTEPEDGDGLYRKPDGVTALTL